MINLIDIKNVLTLFLPTCAQNDLKITWELPQAVKLLLMGKVCLLFTLLVIFLDSNISTSFRVTISIYIYYIYIIYFMYLKYTLNI